jgi:hypothetical protein
MCVCVGVVEIFRTDLLIDLGDDAIQDGVADFMHLFRQQAPAMLTDEIRSALDSSMDLISGKSTYWTSYFTRQ